MLNYTRAEIELALDRLSHGVTKFFDDDEKNWKPFTKLMQDWLELATRPVQPQREDLREAALTAVAWWKDDPQDVTGNLGVSMKYLDACTSNEHKEPK